MKNLVVHYSRTETTKFGAETIAAELGSDIEEIVDLKKRESKLNYMSSAGNASGGKETKISPINRVPSDYDLIIIGTPICLEPHTSNQNLHKK